MVTRELFTGCARRSPTEDSGDAGSTPATSTTTNFTSHSLHGELNVFEIDGNTEADRQTPMFGRGRIDHLALHAASIDAFEMIRDRLVARGAADSFVTDFGPILSLFFRDPDGLECELCVENPDAKPGVFNPPGTPAARYQ